MAIIGIDLGTTNSLASVWRDGKCVLIPNALGEFLTPSAVSIEEDGSILVGRAAQNRLVSHPERTAASFKRFMGTDTVLDLAGRPFTPTELSSFVLRRLKEDAEQYLGTAVEEAVISVPAYFDDNGRSATKTAGELAGFKVERIINEPSAAALAYHHGKTEDETFLVFDFGGGTLDVSVVDAFDNVIEIVAVAGDNRLGGDDFNRVIAEYFCAQNGLVLGKLSRETQASLIRQAEQCKIALTRTDPIVMMSELEGKSLSAALTNQKLIELSAALLRRMEKPVVRALRDSQATIGEISEIVLVGGSSQMPVIRHYLRHILGKTPRCDFDADTTVAIGAGIAAGIKERNSELRDTLLTDICPFTLGINVVNHDHPDDDLFSPIIERNTTLPASRMRSYCTANDGQTHMNIVVYQGESLYCRENLKLGEVEIPVPAAPKGKEGADVRFTYDINGILQVEATCRSTGVNKQTVILNPKLKLTENELTARLKALEKYKLLPREEEENKALLTRAARLHKETSSLLREQIRQQIDYFNLLLHEGHEHILRRYRHELSEFFDKVEAHLEADEDFLRAFRESCEEEDEDEQL